MEASETNTYGSINEVIQKKTYRPALDIYVKNKDLIRLCSEQSPKTFSIYKKIEHKGLTVLPDPSEKENCQYFEQVIIAQIEKFKNLVSSVSFHRQLRLWVQTFGSYYPANYSFELSSCDLLMEIVPDNSYETGLYNRFWLDQALSGKTKLHSPVLDQIRSMRWIYLFTYHKMNDRLSFTEKTISQLKIAILNADLQNLFQAVEQDPDYHFDDSVWTLKQLSDHTIVRMARSWIEEMEKGDQQIMTIAEREINRRNVTDQINAAGSLSQKIQAYANSYKLLKSNGKLYDCGHEPSQGKPFYQLPESMPAGPDELEAYCQYQTLLGKEIEELYLVYENSKLSCEEKLRIQFEVLGSYEGKKVYHNGLPKVLCYLPKSQEEIRAYNMAKVRLYEDIVYASNIADLHRQRSLEERMASFLSFKPEESLKKRAAKEIKNTWKEIPQRGQMRRLLSMLENHKVVPHFYPWTYRQTVCYIIARDAFRYIGFLSRKGRKPALFKIP